MTLVLDRDLKQRSHMTGQVRSAAIPGFEIPVRAIFDPEANQAAPQALLNTTD